jgi:DNA-binding transcriptional regulator YhcF (GntR family)
MDNIYKLIQFDDYSVTPKYLQLSNSILKNIENGVLKKDYILPSINNMGFELDLSRNTVEKAYSYLKNKGILGSVPGKGYYIQNTENATQIKIFLIFNKLSVHKKIIYDSFAKALGQQVIIDFYIYNNDFTFFKKLLTEKKDDYTFYVIIAHFLDQNEKAFEIINNTIPKDKLILMSQQLKGIEGNYGVVYEDFENDIYTALCAALERLKKYTKLNIIFPEYTYHPRSILKGFTAFCQDYAFDYQITKNPNFIEIAEGSVYIILMEDNLVTVVKKLLQANLKVGKQVGIISYNETPIKEIILNGITTISTDFKLMGETAAQMILENSRKHVAVPFRLTLRNSL